MTVIESRMNIKSMQTLFSTCIKKKTHKINTLSTTLLDKRNMMICDSLRLNALLGKEDKISK